MAWPCSQRTAVSHLALRLERPRPLRVTDQWMYHSRLYAAAILCKDTV